MSMRKLVTPGIKGDSTLVVRTTEVTAEVPESQTQEEGARDTAIMEEDRATDAESISNLDS